MLPTVPRPIALLAAISLLFVGCGVRISGPERGTEFWDSIDITGTFTPGGALNVTAAYEQLNPVDVEVICELREEKEQLHEIGRTVVPALPEGSPDATPVAGSVSFDFSAPDDPGAYIVECLTPSDEDNFIGDEIIVEG
jgi:hypothetical protein